MSDVDTSGFYKVQDGQLFFGPNWVVNADYTLHRELDADLGFEVDGWLFYADEATAREMLGLPVQNEDEE